MTDAAGADAVERVKATAPGTGAGLVTSSLTMVPKPRPKNPPKVALVGDVNATKRYSSGSTTVSPTTDTGTDLVVSPGRNVTVPLAGA
jgi:hypothetical protein